MKIKLISAAIIMCCGIWATPASAQATRTWVSGVGDDVNPCSRTAPCKTFAGAISKTATGGEINCLDPGGFGALTIIKSITIDCAGTLGSTLASLTTGFVINAPGAKVTLRNLSINGAGGGTGSGNGLNGIKIIAASSVNLANLTIQGFEGAPGNGILIDGGTPLVFIRDTDISRNRNGITVSAAATANVFVDRVSLTSNSGAGIVSDGSKSKIFVGNSLIAGNATGILGTNGGIIRSNGDNLLEGNTTAGAFTGSVSTKR